MIRGCVVEDHNDIVPFVLKQWKAEASTEAESHQSRVLVHYDAHPDLSLNPETSQEQCSRLAAMVEHLANSSGGIAEFILPLFYCGYVDQCIWVKPHWATQLREGEYVFQLGVDRASGFMRLTCCEDYYLDEEVVVADVEELVDPKAVSLVVLDESNAPERLAALLDSKQWVFDCCLDFFTCSNPFVTDLVEAGVSQHIDAIQALYANAPHRVLSRHQRPAAAGDRGSCGSKLIQAAAEFNRLLKQVYEAKTQEERASLAPALEQLYPEGLGDSVVNEFLAALSNLAADQLEMVQEAAYCMNLPHNITSAAEQEEMLRRMRAAMLPLGGHPPSCVTIALSAMDGFTPLGDADRLQNEVLEILSECFSRPVQIARLETTRETSEQKADVPSSEAALSSNTTNKTTATTPSDNMIRLFDIREDPSLYSHFAIYPSSKRKLTAASAATTDAEPEGGRSWRIEALPLPSRSQSNFQLS